MIINRVQYSISLRVLGHILDQERARMVTICEIDQGFLMHYFPKGDANQARTRVLHSAEIMDAEDALDRQSPRSENKGRGRGGLFNRRGDLQKFLKTHPLLPMGYESLLYALGLKFDGRAAESIVFAETADAVHVDYTIPKADFVVRNGARLILDGRRSDRYTRTQTEGLDEQAEAQARERIQRATQHLSFNPLDAAAHLELARAFDDYGAQRDAEDMYVRVTQLAPQQSEAYYQLARHARGHGDRKGALKHLQQAVTIDSEDGRFLHLLGRLNIERDHLDSAVAALERAISVEPSNPMYHYDLNRAYKKQGRMDAARTALAGFDAQLAPARMAALQPIAPPSTTPTTPSQDIRNQAPGRRLNRRLGQTLPETAPPTAGLSPVPATSNAASTDVPLTSSAFLSPSGTDFPTSVDKTPMSADDGWSAYASAEQTGSGHESISASAPAPESAPMKTDGRLAARTTTKDDAQPSPSRTPLSDQGSQVGPTLPTPPHLLPDAEGSVRVDARTPADDEAQIVAAVAHVRDMVKAEPGRADLHRRLGFLLAKQGRSEEAALEFRRAAEAGRRNLSL